MCTLVAAPLGSGTGVAGEVDFDIAFLKYLALGVESETNFAIPLLSLSGFVSVESITGEPVEPSGDTSALLLPVLLDRLFLVFLPTASGGLVGSSCDRSGTLSVSGKSSTSNSANKCSNLCVSEYRNSFRRGSIRIDTKVLKHLGSWLYVVTSHKENALEIKSNQLICSRVVL